MGERRIGRLGGVLLIGALALLGAAFWVAAAGPNLTVYLPLVQNQMEGPKPTPTPLPPGEWVTAFEETFEGEFPGAWKLSGSTTEPGGALYAWAKRDCRPYEGSYSGWAVGGPPEAALACGVNYPNKTYTEMVYGPFSLEGATRAEVVFQCWVKTAATLDRLAYTVSLDGDDPEVGYHGKALRGDTAGWVTQTLDLTEVSTLGDITGQPEVWVKFAFYSDGTANLPEGVYVDNIEIRMRADGPSEPASARASAPPARGSSPATYEVFDFHE